MISEGYVTLKIEECNTLLCIHIEFILNLMIFQNITVFLKKKKELPILHL